MQARRGFLLTLIPIWALILAPSSAHAQGMGEYAGINAGVAGMGAGVAASLHNGILVRRTYESAVQAQQALVAQNHAVEQYLKLGTQFQAKKEWDNAEKAFTYVLQVIARRDGPGSPNGVPALKHLVAICKAQNKIDQAISFQKTVLAFTQADKKIETQVLIKEQERLSNLFIRKSDYASAEPVLRNTVALYKETPSTSTSKNYSHTLRVYGTVLRQLNRTDEAAQIESQIDEQQTAATSGSETVANAPPLAGNSPNSNTPTTTLVNAAPDNGSTAGSATSAIAQNSEVSTAKTRLEYNTQPAKDTAHISSNPIPVQTSDKNSPDSTIAATPAPQATSNHRASSTEPANAASNTGASIQPNSQNSSIDTSPLPDPSTLSLPEPELIPMPLPMPDSPRPQAQ